MTRSVRHRFRRRLVRWLQIPIIHPRTERLWKRVMSVHRCHHIAVTVRRDP